MDKSNSSSTPYIRCALDHIAMNVNDVDAMLAFYTEVLGLEPERVDAFRSGEVLFPSVRLNADTLIDLFPPSMWKGEQLSEAPAAMNHFCMTLTRSDFEQLVARLEQLSTALETGTATRWGAHGNAQSRYLKDPEGNQLEIRYY